ncbi:hypothetical protein CEQ28_000215 [Hafnia alvei]|nr:hypothetical protein CEQ28_000215 [Hafnia alvei]
MSPIMDLYNGEIIAYNLATRPLPSMVQTMLTDVLKQLPKDEHPILHSDSKNVGVSFHHPACCFSWLMRSLMQ